MTISSELSAALLVYDDAATAVEDYFERGWTDGLPIVPPTADLVSAFLDHAGLSPQAVLGEVPTRQAVMTAELAAINAVMAGCRAEYFPVVVAALRAHLSPLGNSHCTTGTVTGAAHLLIVNGPIRDRIGVASGLACMGPGYRANATIGRAFRLALRNVLRAVPGILDMATFSSPLRYSFCIGENEETAQPWRPLHVERGLAEDQSAVTVATALSMIAVGSFERTPQGILADIAKEVRQRGAMTIDDYLGDSVGVVFVVGYEHMRFFHAAGWSKSDLQECLFPMLAAEVAAPDEHVVAFPSPASLLIVAAGGPGIAETRVIMPHLGAPITQLITNE